MGVRRAARGHASNSAQAASPHGERPGNAARAGLAAIPADRHAYALAGEPLGRRQLRGRRRRSGALRIAGCGSTRAAMRAAAREAVRAFDVQGVRSSRQKAALLSGGNAQKLVIAREFAGAPRLVLAHSPSRGLDVRAAPPCIERLRERAGTRAPAFC